MKFCFYFLHSSKGPQQFPAGQSYYFFCGKKLTGKYASVELYRKIVNSIESNNLAMFRFSNICFWISNEFAVLGYALPFITLSFITLCEKCLYSEFFWSASSRIRTEYYLLTRETYTKILNAMFLMTNKIITQNFKSFFCYLPAIVFPFLPSRFEHL